MGDWERTSLDNDGRKGDPVLNQLDMDLYGAGTGPSGNDHGKFPIYDRKHGNNRNK